MIERGKKMEEITNCRIITNTSQKTGKPYSAIEIMFKNGYKIMHFLNYQEQFILGLNSNLNTSTPVKG